ncbi:D-isomer specific 2-hydroxyacid dehydrogenase NAD-binding [Methylobacterium sp. 4-46]|uniref:phosphoglycerate dehydrogenase n=1 Tax=unclassified Methylobacterium TaxID=2615210 RepID=UPI000152E143|nr:MULTISPECIES: phosphoglycerate dehydrogenase [Methylobacterium]ACA18146.1 D-isomer specific 2-hydroxyacid dehydrogenase NAD-binding [Methylobacterium sp. 4-46]WFT77444.1 phosphoglycerate dehydrogenase [Methylobacterium nodulans]
MADKLSLPKDKIRVLLLEGINDSAVSLLNAAGYTNVTRLAKALDPADLREALRGTHLLGIRSRTQLDEGAFEAADRLIAVGCFSVGTNQVDLQAARRRGIPVFNAPFSNTRSVAELVIGEIVMLLRRIVPRSVSAHAGGWDKSAANSFEVRGKTLGIVGYGNIGSQLSNLAEAMGMRVIFYDLTDRLRHGNTEPVETLDDLLGQSDVVSLHVPETPATHTMIGEAQIRAMKPGAYLINNSRGTVVDLDALAGALRDGHLRGAAVDVFPVEPKSNQERFVSPLQGLENVILTPHVGGSTEEAQERIGAEVARKLVDYSDIGSTFGAVNFPQVQLAARPLGTRYIHVQRNIPGMLRRLNDVFARQGINIAAQFYQTDGEVGYVVIETDAVEGDAEALLEEIRQLEGTIRARLLYERR